MAVFVGLITAFGAYSIIKPSVTAFVVSKHSLSELAFVESNPIRKIEMQKSGEDAVMFVVTPHQELHVYLWSIAIGTLLALHLRSKWMWRDNVNDLTSAIHDHPLYSSYLKENPSHATLRADKLSITFIAWIAAKERNEQAASCNPLPAAVLAESTVV